MEDQALREAGLKVTIPRVKVLKTLSNSEQTHLSAEDIYRALLAANEEIALATVYRVLTQFEENNLVIRHNFDGGYSVFELASNSHHDHMVCVESGKIIEFYNAAIEKLQEEIANEKGYELVNHSLTLYVKPLRKEEK